MHTDHISPRFFLPGLLLAGLALTGFAQDKAPQAAPAPAAVPAPKTAAKKAPAPMGCVVADFRTMVLDTHMPEERSRLATQWLLKNGPACNEEQITMIRANRALWLGTSDTVALMGLVDRIVEARQSGRPDALQGLYAAPVAARNAGNEVVQATGGTRPIVAPAGAAGMPLVVGAQVPAMPGQPAQGTPLLRPDWNGENR